MLFYFSCVLNVSTDPLASDSRFNVVLCPSVLTNESVSCHRGYRLSLVLSNQRATGGVEVKKEAERRRRLRAQAIVLIQLLRLSFHPAYYFTLSPRNNKLRLSSLSVDNTTRHVIFSMGVELASYELFDMREEGIVHRVPFFLSDQPPVYPRHCHSTILSRKCTFECFIFAQTSGLCFNVH